MKQLIRFSIVAGVLVLASCGKPLPELKDFDRAAWSADKNGCNGKRAGMMESIAKQTEKLLSLDEMEIVSLLGKPDQNELHKRNQKFFHYLITPSKACDAANNNEEFRLSIRFNAVGRAKEVAIEKV